MRCGGEDRLIHASRAIEHPGRNLKPASGIGAAQRAAEHNIIRLVDRLMDKDRQTEPWMPPIQKLAKAGPVGVIKLRCTTERVRIRDDGAMAKRPCRLSLTHCPLRRRNCCRPRNAGHRIFVGHSPRRRAKRQVKYILLQFRQPGPARFHRMRHFGFMANRHCATKLALCCSLLDHERTAPNNAEPSSVDSDAQTWPEVPACPDCGGIMCIIERFRHSCSRSSHRTPPFRCDTS